MTDQMHDQPIVSPAESTDASAPLSRVFKIGANRVVEDASTMQLSNEQARDLLKISYPEVANATIRERIDLAANLRIVEFLPQPGRKG
ncbi:MAG: hypothetical protein IT324_06855 [Anaerolineae bacterium]|nr:hypothetical protein [Anaerolineae bacterium]